MYCLPHVLPWAVLTTSPVYLMCVLVCGYAMPLLQLPLARPATPVAAAAAYCSLLLLPPPLLQGLAAGGGGPDEGDGGDGGDG